jgi:hypothetical protein
VMEGRKSVDSQGLGNVMQEAAIGSDPSATLVG